jgi:hypothetical protein
MRFTDEGAVVFDDIDELAHALIGRLGGDMRDRADACLLDMLKGEQGEQLQGVALELHDELEKVSDEEIEANESLADSEDDGSDEIAAAEERAQELGADAFADDAEDDQATALIAAELERLAEFKGRPLTQGQIEEAIAAIPYEAHDGGLVPDLVKELGQKFRDGDLADAGTRVQRGEERFEEVKGGEDASNLLFDREQASSDEQHDRLERGLEALVAAREGVDEGATRDERMAAAHDAVLALSADGAEAGADE